MKSLVVYYSLSGRTKIVANELAKNLSADIEEIQDQKDRKGILRQIWAGLEAGMKKSTTIAASKFNPADYDLVLIGTPIWASSMACAARAWLEQHKKDLKHVAFFATMGGSGDVKAFKEMTAFANQVPIATLTVTDKNIAKNNYQQQLNDFLTKLVIS
jgi:flavodoxin